MEAFHTEGKERANVRVGVEQLRCENLNGMRGASSQSSGSNRGCQSHRRVRRYPYELEANRNLL